MKALKFIVLAVVACFLFASCGQSVDSLIDNYSKACKAGDYEKAAKIAEKLDAKEKEAKFTEEQYTKILEAALDCAKEGVEKMNQAAKDMEDLSDFDVDEEDFDLDDEDLDLED